MDFQQKFNSLFFGYIQNLGVSKSVFLTLPMEDREQLFESFSRTRDFKDFASEFSMRVAGVDNFLGIVAVAGIGAIVYNALTGNNDTNTDTTDGSTPNNTSNTNNNGYPVNVVVEEPPVEDKPNYWMWGTIALVVVLGVVAFFYFRKKL